MFEFPSENILVLDVPRANVSRWLRDLHRTGRTMYAAKHTADVLNHNLDQMTRSRVWPMRGVDENIVVASFPPHALPEGVG